MALLHHVPQGATPDKRAVGRPGGGVEVRICVERLHSLLPEIGSEIGISGAAELLKRGSGLGGEQRFRSLSLGIAAREGGGRGQWTAVRRRRRVRTAKFGRRGGCIVFYATIRGIERWTSYT